MRVRICGHLQEEVKLLFLESSLFEDQGFYLPSTEGKLKRIYR